MNVELFAAFLLAALVINLTPGPGMLFILAQGLTGGRRAGRAAACGTASGMLVHTSAVALGLAAVLHAAPIAMDVLRFAGAAYLLWMAFQSLRKSELTSATPGEAVSDRFAPVYVRGLINSLTNPKILLFYLAFLPQFVDPSLGHQALQLFTLGLTMLLIGLAVDLTVGTGAVRVGHFLRHHRAANHWLPRAAGTAYGVLAAGLILGAAS
jgi:threonine/homoserine/homoserine lactone efflux protein